MVIKDYSIETDGINMVWRRLRDIIILLVFCGITEIFCLSLGIGNENIILFKTYFVRPLVLVLNFIPILLLCSFFLAVTGRLSWAFALGTLPFLAASIGHYYKEIFRREPFTFSDFSFISAAFEVSSEYDFTINTRIILFSCYYIVTIAALFFLSKKFLPIAKRKRLQIALITLVSCIPLWIFVYSSDAIYKSDFLDDDRGTFTMSIDNSTFVTRGFIYSFIHSAKDGIGLPPNGYSKEKYEELYASFSNSPIEEDKRVNLIVFQLESFSDLTDLNIEGISGEAFSIYHDIKEESYHGKLITSIYAGGTIVTEHSVLTGDSIYYVVSSRQPSFVRYFGDNGYITTGSHPLIPNCYYRDLINKGLGFDEYRLANIEDGKLMFDGVDLYQLKPTYYYSDCILFPSVLNQFFDYAASGRPVFSFNVSLQGHGQYNSEELLFDQLYYGEELSGSSFYMLNNYLGSMSDTQKQLRSFMDKLEESDYPVVLVIYGDHKGNFVGGDDTEINVFGEGITGQLAKYSTEYLIWANTAARENYGYDFVGEGPTISPNYLFPLLFGKLGWGGNAYSKYLMGLFNDLPVITTNGIYLEGDEYTEQLSEKAQAEINEYSGLQYYMHHELKLSSEE